jgi:hypothetical protein
MEGQTMAGTVERQGEVNREMAELASLIDNQRTVVEMLCKKLSSLLNVGKMDSVNGVKEDVRPDSELCPLASDLRGRRYKLAESTLILERLTENLEL